MSHPFDATIKELVRRYPLDWLKGLDIQTELPVRALDSELSTISTEADKVLGIGDPLSSVVHIEFQSSRDPSLAPRLLVYNGLLYRRFKVPVHTSVVLLRKQADEPSMNGILRYDTQGGRAGVEFRFEVLRIWERPASTLLTGGLGMVPLAALGELPEDSSPEAAFTGVLRRIDKRLAGELPADDAKRLLMAAWILTGMRVEHSQLKLLKESFEMVDLRDSSTYWVILEEGIAEGEARGEEKGRAQGKMEGKMEGKIEGKMEGKVEGEAEGLRAMLLEIGSQRLGAPAADVQTALTAIHDSARLRRMGQRMLGVSNWQALLAIS